MGWIGCAILQVAQKAILRIQFVCFIFLESPRQVDMKNVVKSSKHFFEYFNTQETHSEESSESFLVKTLRNNHYQQILYLYA